MEICTPNNIVFDDVAQLNNLLTITLPITQSEVIAANDLVCLTNAGAGRVQRADNTNSMTATVLGIAKSGGTGNLAGTVTATIYHKPGTILPAFFAEAQSVGNPVYLDEDGDYTLSVPNGPGQSESLVGYTYGLDGKGLLFMPFPAIAPKGD